jgi:hypothetical protein
MVYNTGQMNHKCHQVGGEETSTPTRQPGGAPLLVKGVVRKRMSEDGKSLKFEDTIQEGRGERTYPTEQPD